MSCASIAFTNFLIKMQPMDDEIVPKDDDLDLPVDIGDDALDDDLLGDDDLGTGIVSDDEDMFGEMDQSY